MDVYKKIESIKKKIKVNNNDLGELLGKTGDAFRKSLSRKNLNDYELILVAEAFKIYNVTTKNSEAAHEIAEFTSFIKKKIAKNKSYLLDKILSENEEENLIEKLKDDPAYLSVFNDFFSVHEPVVHYSKKGKQIPYYRMDFRFHPSIDNYEALSYIVHEDFDGIDFWIDYTGSSMEPVINSGETIGFKEIAVSSILYGELYALNLEKQGTIQYVRKSDKEGYVKLTPNNQKDYDIQEIPISSIKSIYLVLGSIKKIS
ncbi:hypothetical protein HX109_15530 [Galbibacter sp. BG1]|uniref:S24 family peptidase n=1 Tax=Galbibacter sp. BG1 TaxID=1170699 RepID=UPI0015B79760|nr:S24 family peptidase [Galbibacter sp. BG1]QLE02911.1 hypothetical protein HX109_15530 [Galbibacter sp. BG1]